MIGAAVEKGALVFGAIGLLIAVVWFVGKSLFSHVLSNWILAKLAKKRRKDQDAVRDDPER